MKTMNLIYSQLLILLFLVGCNFSNNDEPNFMAFDQIVNITEFPKTYHLVDKSKPEIDIIGIRNFAIYDSTLIIYTTRNDGIWTILSLPNYNDLGKYLKIGEGPLEFMQSPSVASNNSIIRENNQLIAYLYDFEKGRILKFDIDKSVEQRTLDLEVLNDSILPFLFNFAMIDSTTFFIKKFEYSPSRQIRQIYKNGTLAIPKFMELLNNSSLMEGEDINILSTITKYSNINKKIVEMPVGLNYLNIYSLDGSFSKSICIGNNPFNINTIQRTNMWNRTRTFDGLRVFKNYFAVIHINEKEINYQMNRKKFPSILVFDWDGNPLMELKMESHITSFDIDFINKELYTFDVHSDEFYKYDISNIMN
ncbi:MAG: BF3164 family lipoprotein [Algoriphagus sp.]|uniref:BF3164 family lipoprotein n=3 Tax=Algoriphagus sp. TaxID=1872435 RepID=UPI0027337EF8|nr:BF3164 family lipoprotein [Algoriphagus sp.]MDP2043226.1 BF3164 family lipoprotein [Algoriphagus sp.]MDP3474297.1 BF3164 family lipoprotein [Algoriphagus sp.]